MGRHRLGNTMGALLFTMVGIRVFGVTTKTSKPIEADEAISATVQRSDVAHDSATSADGICTKGLPPSTPSQPGYNFEKGRLQRSGMCGRCAPWRLESSRSPRAIPRTAGPYHREREVRRGDAREGAIAPSLSL